MRGMLIRVDRAPFWTAFVYAIVMRRKQAREFEDEAERGTLLKLLW
jgi:hypothetical protein